jgi:transcriptional regulator GlxA family with amidase domain
MRTAFVVFNRMTALDFVGIYDPVTRLRSMGFLPDFDWEVCARTPEVEDDRGLRFRATAVGGSLEGYDLLVVPGGMGTRTLMLDPTFMEWLRTAAPAPLKVSVCSGALLLGAAGFLEGKRATTHWGAFQELAPMCRAVVEGRIVDEGTVITAGGVTAALDAGLYVVERLAGPGVAARIRRQMDYPYSVAPLDHRP